MQKCSIQLIGWGKPHVGGDPVHMLQELKVPIVNHKICHDRNAASGRSVTEKMICSGHNNGLEYSSGWIDIIFSIDFSNQIDFYSAAHVLDLVFLHSSSYRKKVVESYFYSI